MYAKIFAQIYDGTLCTKGPWQALVTFQQLLVLADKDGHVDMTAAAISRRTTIPLEIIEAGIDALMQDDPDSRTPTENGRRIVPLSGGRNWGWSIVNYKHYRALKREEERKEYHRNYWNEKRSAAAHTQQETQQLNQINQTHQTQRNQPIAEAEAVNTLSTSLRSVDKTPRFAAAQYLSGLGVDEKVIRDWMAHRKAKKAVITETVIAGLDREAKRAGISLEAAMRESCVRGWVGFKAEWVMKNGGGNGSGKQTRLDQLQQCADELTGRDRRDAGVGAIDGTAVRVD
jgi:hypothetical protein